MNGTRDTGPSTRPFAWAVDAVDAPCPQCELAHVSSASHHAERVVEALVGEELPAPGLRPEEGEPRVGAESSDSVAWAWSPGAELNATMTGIGSSLVAAFDFVWDRFATRLVGLTDEELRWSPAGEPVPTIAWRIEHIADCFPTFADRLFPERRPPDRPGQPSDAAAVVPFLDWSFRYWRAGLSELTDGQLGVELGATWGPYGSSTATDVALHVFDELVHHAAEIALLRDLYAHRSPS